MGRQAPGVNNVVDGLLRFKDQKSKVELIGFINGVDGLLNNDFVPMTRETFKNYVNLGGIDYIGRGFEQIRDDECREKVAAACKKLSLTGLVCVGGTQAMTDCAHLSNYFLKQKVETSVIVIPGSVDGNIHHKYISSSIGFDSASKVYSQLIGNMLTDSASAVKYWYFVRLMGNEPSHLALECALNTCPNMVIVSEESNSNKETLDKIVNRICDTICERASQDNNYGCVLIPEGLLKHLSSFNQLIEEINDIFRDAQKSIVGGNKPRWSDEESDPDAVAELQQKLLEKDSDISDLLTPWSHSLFNSLPEFLKQQLLIERQMSGSIKLSQIETEKLVAYMVNEEL